MREQSHGDVAVWEMQHGRRQVLLGLLATLALTPAGWCASPKPDLSGQWRQTNERCVPPRTGDVSRSIDQRGSELVVETTVSRGSGTPRHGTQRYSVDGVASVSTGADGDEFHTSVVWKDGGLLFSIEEHEDGRIILSRELWTLIENGSVLQVEREILGSAGGASRRQTLIYRRQ